MKYFVFLVSCSLVFSCSTTHCKDQEKKDSTKNSPNAAAVMSPEISSAVAGVKLMTKVKVFKADGTLQCQQGKKIELTTMSKELAGITIYSSENLHDGLMRIQLCGKPTGQNNVYEINESDLPKALSLGFKKWIR